MSNIVLPINEFNFDGVFIHSESFGKGHINDTYAIYFKHEFIRPLRYILQKVNTKIFTEPLNVMSNIKAVTHHIRQKLINQNRFKPRLVLEIIKSGLNDYFIDSEGQFWRAFHFIDDAVSYQQATPELFYESGAAFGNFFAMLSDFPAGSLFETIPNFHNTKLRFKALTEAVKNDSAGRAAMCKEEIEFAFERESDASVLVNMLDRGELPLRVTHNDTKLNNVMIDIKTNKSLAVIDLDTVMPGLSLYDFGDSIRFGASTGAEDEKDLSKINFDINMYKAYAEGYLSGANGLLTDDEKNMLPFACKIMTYECGIRFLTDFLNGDTYFKTTHENHNLDRCRTQFKLVADMEKQLDDMLRVIL